jgi:hypothetical protein
VGEHGRVARGSRRKASSISGPRRHCTSSRRARSSSMVVTSPGRRARRSPGPRRAARRTEPAPIAWRARHRPRNPGWVRSIDERAERCWPRHACA